MQQRITNFYKPGHRVENTQARTDQKTSNKDTIPAKSENFMDSLKVTQINLKRKAEAWGHLLGSLAGTKGGLQPKKTNPHPVFGSLGLGFLGFLVFFGFFFGKFFMEILKFCIKYPNT